MRLSPVAIAVQSNPHQREPAFVLKSNPHHDAAGRFTTADKAVFQMGQVKEGLNKLATFDLNQAGIKHVIDTVAVNYLKYLKNVGGSGGSIEHFAQMENLGPDTVKKLKGVIAAKKAWQAMYKNKAVAVLSSEDLLKAAKGTMEGDAKATAKYEQMLDAATAQFHANGGSKEDWAAHVKGLTKKLAAMVSEKAAPPPVDSGTVLSVPKSKPDNWASMSAGQKAAWTKANKPKNVPGVDANTVLKPKVTAAPTHPADANSLKPYDGLTKVWEDPGSLNHAKLQNEALGKSYYLLRDKLGKDHPEVAKLYDEWQKSKDYLKANGVTDISSLSTSQKQAAEATLEQYKKATVGAKTTLANVAASYHEALGSPLSEQGKADAFSQLLDKAKAHALAAGMSESDAAAVIDQAKSKANAALMEKKASALPKLEKAAYASAMAKSGGDAQAYDQQKSLFDQLKKEASQWGFSDADIKSMMSKGAAQAVADQKKQAKLVAALGDKGKLLQYYDKEFSPLSVSQLHGHYLSMATTPEQKAYQEHHLQQVQKLTSKQDMLLKSFLGSGYEGMNKGYNEEGKIELDKGLSQMKLGANVTVRRNMAQKWLWESLGINDWEHGLSNEQIESAIGKVYKEKSIISTTKSLNNEFTMSATAQNSGTASLIIRMHKDIHAIDSTIAKNSSSSENEITVASGLTMVVRKVEKQGPGNVKYKVYVDALYNDNEHVKELQ